MTTYWRPVRVPWADPPAAAEYLVEFETVRLHGNADAGGTTTIALDPVPVDELWEIDRINVGSNSTTPTRCRVYDSADGGDEQNLRHLVDSTLWGNLAVADEISPIRLESGRQLVIVWDGGSAGSRCGVRVQYRIIRRS